MKIKFTKLASNHPLPYDDIEPVMFVRGKFRYDPAQFIPTFLLHQLVNDFGDKVDIEEWIFKTPTGQCIALLKVYKPKYRLFGKRTLNSFDFKTVSPGAYNAIIEDYIPEEAGWLAYA